MSIGKTLFTLIPVILLSILLSSCISINRQIKVNKNGSGSEIMELTFQKAFYDIMSSMTSLMDSTRREGFLDSLYSDDVFQNKTVEEYDSIEGIKIINISSVLNEDSSKTFTINYEFDEIKKIGSSLSHINENDDKYQTVVNFSENDGKVYFLYEYKLKDDDNTLDENGDTDSLAQQMKLSLAKMFEGGSFDFEVELPFDVISTNADQQNGRNLKWVFPMSDVFTKDVIRLEAEMINQ